MANTELTLSMFSQVALNVALDMGFSAVEAELFSDPEDFELRLLVRFGDEKELRKPRLRTPCEWARSYDVDAKCIRNQKTIEVPNAIRFESCESIKAKLTEQLLELA